MKETSRGMRQVMTVVAVLVGLFMIGAAPWLAQVSLDLVLENLGRAAQQKPALSSGLMLFDLFYPLLRALVFVAGTALLVISYPLLQGEEWAYGLSLLLLAIPAVSGMFMFLPYVSFVKDAAPLPLFITLGGLIGFWTVLLGKKGDGRDRVTRFFAFTFMGMSITHSLTTGVGCLRQLMTRPGHPLYGDVGWWVLSLCGQVLWVSALLILIGLPLLAQAKRSGWYLVVIGAVSTVLVSVPTQFIRGWDRLDYVIGTGLALGILTTHLLPALKARLLTPGTTDTSVEGAALEGTVTAD